MRPDLTLLPWLNQSQALTYLQHNAQVDLTAEDLLSHAEHGNCEVFINNKGLKGKLADYHIMENGDATIACRGVGKQRVLNPQAILCSGKEIELFLVGDVLVESYTEHHERLKQQEWSTPIDPKHLDIVYPLTSLQHLSDLIAKAVDRFDPREKESMCLIIMGLATLAKVNTEKPDTFTAALRQTLHDLGLKKVLCDGTIVKHVKAAREICKNRAGSPQKKPNKS